MTELCLSVRDLSSPSAPAGARRWRSTASRSTSSRASPWRWSANPAPANRSTALSILRLLPYPAAHHPSGSDHLQGPRPADACRERDMRRVRGDDITIVFQEPMTSLNPLHTIEKQIGEILLLHRGLTGAAVARTHARSAEPGRHSRSASAARELSASAVRRPAPARDDRHGARQRARSAHRRRADHRARRHRAGADHRAAQGPPGAARHVAVCSSPTTSASCARSRSGSA